MHENRARILDDLRGMLAGELLFEPLERAAYAHDASLYEVDPLGAIAPRTEQDLCAIARYATEHAISLHARGAGTGRAGGALGPGLILDFSRHFRRVVEIGADWVVVQPGVVLDVLNAQLEPLGRRVALDPDGSDVCTIGGLIGRDAAGVRSLRYGTTADQVMSLRVVFANGDVGDCGVEPWPAFDDEPIDFKQSVARKIAGLARRNADSLARKTSAPSCVRAGYALHAAATLEGVDLARILTGSEGTLALVTEATLKTVAIPAAQGALLVPFARIADAAAAVLECRAAQPASCDLYDWRMLRLIREAVPRLRDSISEGAEAALVVGFEGDDPDAVQRSVHTLAQRLARSGRITDDPVEVAKRGEYEAMLGLRRAVEPLLMRAKGRSRPVPLIEELAIPPEALPDFLARLQVILKAHDTSWTLDGRAGEGIVRIRPFLDLSDPSDAAKLEPVASHVYDAAWECGGSVPGAGNCGLLRSQFLRRQLGDTFQVMREIKDAFDPVDILNPGKVINDDPRQMTRNLRRFPAPRPIDEPAHETESENGSFVFLPVLRWQDRSPVEIGAACNGCGSCRSQEPSLRMCPVFRADHSERATPRAKANLVRQVASGAVDPRSWGSEEFKKNADLCIHCNLCRDECPSGLDVSGLMLEAKAAYVQNHGLQPVDWLLSRVEVWSRLASRLPILSNALMASGPARWLFERVLGLSRLRRLPKAHRTPFVRRIERFGLTRPRPQAPGPRVAYFVDIFANYFDQELAEAVVAVLHQAGVNVYVPRGQRGSGMPALVAGDVDYARELALRNLRILGEAVRDGYTIVCSEPTASLMLRDHYLRLTDDLDAELVAENTMDVGQYLAGLDARGQLPAPQQALRARVGYHQPCHLRSLGIGTPGLDLIRKIPELDIQFIDRGCSGMAGTYGLARDHFRTSLRAGRGLLSRLRDPDIEIGATECGACRMQMEQGVTKRTLHPIKLLSLSYGLNPSLRRLWKEPKSRRSLS
ncbi:MAG: FAD-linked oxidase C-terminal domain-containing protein [Isosphaeraceae bacterium]|nr:FAD-linked oxidase C-terminal domain-containing protein [Isosphaeraceae bacterium]